MALAGRLLHLRQLVAQFLHLILLLFLFELRRDLLGPELLLLLSKHSTLFSEILLFACKFIRSLNEGGFLVLQLLLDLPDLGIATLCLSLSIRLNFRQLLHKVSELLLSRKQLFLGGLLTLCRLVELLALIIDLGLELALLLQ